jgi:hypothetical protein
MSIQSTGLQRRRFVHFKYRGIALLPLASACLQSVHGDGPSGSPILGWPARVLEERPGHGTPVIGGDRIRVELTGRYASGEIWGQGPLTFIVGSGTYPGAVRSGGFAR